MTKYKYRKYNPGDENFINELYWKVTGLKRSNDQYFWQWFNAPGGKAEIWLIEALHDDGSKRLIGHHGVMPIRFSYGDNNLLFGKTENTLVHPDYRKKILYPRFEKRFLSKYEQRFHALFSTMGPRAAIRQRKAQGYLEVTEWCTKRWSLSSFSKISYIVTKIGFKYLSKMLVKYNQKQFNINAYTISGIRISAYNKQEAKKEILFQTYWNNIKRNYGITPSRDYEDLKWRFWDNPYNDYITIVLDHPSMGIGVAIVNKPYKYVAKIDDFTVEYPKSKLYKELIDGLFKYLKINGIHVVEMTTTKETIDWVGKNNFEPKICKYNLPLIINKNNLPRKMPRKICPNGKSLSLKETDWYITGIVTEGRR